MTYQKVMIPSDPIVGVIQMMLYIHGLYKSRNHTFWLDPHEYCYTETISSLNVVICLSEVHRKGHKKEWKYQNSTKY